MAELSPQQIKDILNKKEHWVVLSTTGPNGYPHSVPIGYFLIDNKLILGCRDGTQKVKNIERDGRVSLLWENGRGEDSLKGILFQGDARIVRDSAERMELKAEACRQRGVAPPSELSSTSVYIEVTPVKTISWDRPSRGRKSRS
jgi:nitroimidazol reductase NimA-like FMN-containing flavoprotein (pyridoxamine 5'-phosphate oxidase superfamily)